MILVQLFQTAAQAEDALDVSSFSTCADPCLRFLGLQLGRGIHDICTIKERKRGLIRGRGREGRREERRRGKYQSDRNGSRSRLGLESDGMESIHEFSDNSSPALSGDDDNDDNDDAAVDMDDHDVHDEGLMWTCCARKWQLRQQLSASLSVCVRDSQEAARARTIQINTNNVNDGINDVTNIVDSCSEDIFTCDTNDSNTDRERGGGIISSSQSNSQRSSNSNLRNSNSQMSTSTRATTTTTRNTRASIKKEKKTHTHSASRISSMSYVSTPGQTEAEGAAGVYGAGGVDVQVDLELRCEKWGITALPLQLPVLLRCLDDVRSAIDESPVVCAHCNSRGRRSLYSPPPSTTDKSNKTDTGSSSNHINSIDPDACRCHPNVSVSFSALLQQALELANGTEEEWGGQVMGAVARCTSKFISLSLGGYCSILVVSCFM